MTELRGVSPLVCRSDGRFNTFARVSRSTCDIMISAEHRYTGEATMGSTSYSLNILNYPNSLRTSALGVNDRGEVVGAYSLFSLTSASYLYQDGNYVPLGAPGDP